MSDHFSLPHSIPARVFVVDFPCEKPKKTCLDDKSCKFLHENVIIANNDLVWHAGGVHNTGGHLNGGHHIGDHHNGGHPNTKPTDAKTVVLQAALKKAVTECTANAKCTAIHKCKVAQRQKKGLGPFSSKFGFGKDFAKTLPAPGGRRQLQTSGAVGKALAACAQDNLCRPLMECKKKSQGNGLILFSRSGCCAIVVS